jgi:ABC-type polysaccharide/polyol phosphate transport system ATPase subunit
VDADILIVDEVLAVGDFAFERKCFAFIEEFKQKNGTILFVSHDREDVLQVSDRCIWLKDGQVEQEGDPLTVLDAYESGTA